MSTETLEHLNINTLIGMVKKRGKAWHYRADLQGTEPNHYDGPIPIEDVRRRLMAWRAIARRVAVEFPSDLENMTHLSADGQPMRWAVQEDRQAIAPSDEDHVMGMFKSGYQPHQYDEWLLNNVATILDDDLVISSAGLLRNRAVAWVEVSVPDTVETPEGVSFRPNLLAATSFDGSLSTTLKRTVQMVVCDNTMTAALGEKGQTVKVRHSSKSLTKIADVREALAIVHTTADTFATEVARLTSANVSRIQFRQVIDALVPIDPSDSKRSRNAAESKRSEIGRLYHYDPRVEQWTGTAFGVLQAFNTWRHHEQGGLSGGTSDAKRTARADRNAYRAVTGETEREDRLVLDALADILG